MGRCLRFPWTRREHSEEPSGRSVPNLSLPGSPGHGRDPLPAFWVFLGSSGNAQVCEVLVRGVSPLLVQAGIRLGNAARQSPPSFLRTSCLSHVVEKSFPNTSIPFTRWRSSTEFTQKVGKWRFASFPVCSRPSCRCWRERFDPSGMAADPMTRQLFWVQLHLGLNPFPNQELPKGRAQGRALPQFLRKLRAAFCLCRGSGMGL